MDIFLQEYRCKCGKLLFKGNFEDFKTGCKIEIKCRKCGEVKLIDFSSLDKTENKKRDFDVKNREC